MKQALEISNRIDSLGLDDIVKAVAEKEHWTIKQALTVSKLYKRFLFLGWKYRETIKLVPTEEIDCFWHFHILETQRYQKDCQAIFGRYLHHSSEITEQASESDKFQKTLDIYEQEFHENLPQVTTLTSKLVVFLYRGIKKMGGLIFAVLRKSTMLVRSRT